MALSRALFALILFGPAVAFVTPSSTHNVLASHGRARRQHVVSEVAPVYETVIGSSEDKIGDAARNLAIGVMLGFVVGFSALSRPASAEEPQLRNKQRVEFALTQPDKPVAYKGECIRQNGCTGEALDAWAKAKASAMDPGDPKPNAHSIPTTGAGRYRFYGLDALSPIKNVTNSTDGTYKSTTEEKLALQEVEKAATRERVASLMGRSPYTSTYSPYNAYPPKTTGAGGNDGIKINLDITAK